MIDQLKRKALLQAINCAFTLASTRKSYLPDVLSGASLRSNALLVISNKASSGDEPALLAELLDGLSGESLSDRSERESSSAERGLRLGIIR